MKSLNAVRQKILVAAFSLGATTALFAQGTTAFSYNGRLAVGTSSPAGYYDFSFGAYGQASGGSLVAGPITNLATMVGNDGSFSVTLDFGNGTFNGSGRWLEISVRTNGPGTFTILTPRQQIMPTPYALYAPNAGSAAAAVTVTGPVAAAQLTGTLSSNNFSPGSITAPMLAAGSVTTGALLNGAVTGPKIATSSNISLFKIENPYPATDDSFGFAVAAMGSDRILVSQYRNEAYLLSTNGAVLARIVNPVPAPNNHFGSAVATIGGDRMLIGDAWSRVNGIPVGAAFLFKTNGSLLLTITNPVPQSGAFGYSVAALGSDRLIIGDSETYVDGYNYGRAYLFSTNGTLIKTISTPPPPGGVGGMFGYRVRALGNDRVIISAPTVSLPVGVQGSGAVYLFHTDGTLLRTITMPSPITWAGFGYDLAVAGADRLLITGAGKVFLFDTNGVVLATYISPYVQPPDVGGESFGNSVAFWGNDRVLIGAPWTFFGGKKIGASYVFSLDGAFLTTITNPSATVPGAMGWNVAPLANDRMLVSAQYDIAGGVLGGAVYIAAFENFTPGLVADGVRANSVTAGSLIDSAVVTSKLADGAVTGAKIQDGSITSADLNASSFSNVFWKVDGNAGTTPGLSFLGTTDNKALELKVAAQRALRLEPNLNGPNLIGGHASNYVSAGVLGASIGGGATNAIGSSFGTIGGGFENTVLPGATNATIPGGRQARAASYGQMAQASGQFSAPGDAQTSVFVCRGTTTNATPTELFLDGSAQRILIPTNSTWRFDVLVSARTASGTSAGYQIGGVIKNNGGVTTLVGNPTVFSNSDDPTWTATIVANGASNALAVQVTGVADTSIRWVARVTTAEVTY